MIATRGGRRPPLEEGRGGGPPGQVAAGVIAAGRFGSDGVASGALPGLFTVVSIDARADTMQLRDGEGRTGTVHVEPSVFDIETLKAGDAVEVDFKVPMAGSPGLEAGGVWRVEH